MTVDTQRFKIVNPVIRMVMIFMMDIDFLEMRPVGLLAAFNT
jgi:hypothetical protein